MERESPRYTPDAQLAYDRSRWRLEPGAGLPFDDAYRLAHLPLVAPEHPRALHSVPGRDYRSGRYDVPRFSLVVPVEAEALSESATFRELERDLAARSFAPKVAWSLLPQRAPKLHVTLAGDLAANALTLNDMSRLRALQEDAPVRYRVGGPFCGVKNHGRLYFTIYPELIGGEDAFARWQDALGAARTSLYLLGYYNLLDELTPAEASDLSDYLSRWRDATIAELEVGSLVILENHDDLALQSRAVSSFEV